MPTAKDRPLAICVINQTKVPIFPNSHKFDPDLDSDYQYTFVEKMLFVARIVHRVLPYPTWIPRTEQNNLFSRRGESETQSILVQKVKSLVY